MKREGILHPELLDLIAAAGHGDVIVLADAGLTPPIGQPAPSSILKPKARPFEHPHIWVLLGTVSTELVGAAAACCRHDARPAGLAPSCIRRPRRSSRGQTAHRGSR